MGFYAKLEKKFGRFAIKNITLVLIICYAAGYVLEAVNPEFLYYLSLDPVEIVHGQVWRLVSWLLIPPPESNMFFAIIMLVFYYSIGTTLERTWGTFHYNFYLFMGMIFTIMGSFLLMAYCNIRYPDGFGGLSASAPTSWLSLSFSTYYVNMSIFLAYACTFPDNEVYVMFILPIKVKWLGVIYGAFIGYEMIYEMIAYRATNGFVYPFVIGASLLNFIVFFFTTRKYIVHRYRRTKAQKAYRAQTRNFEYERHKMEESKASSVSKHKCAICGRTERDGEDLVFRFCSKCDGNYEYCQDHLYTHIHFNKGGQ